MLCVQFVCVLLQVRHFEVGHQYCYLIIQAVLYQYLLLGDVEACCVIAGVDLGAVHVEGASALRVDLVDGSIPLNVAVGLLAAGRGQVDVDLGEGEAGSVLRGVVEVVVISEVVVHHKSLILKSGY